MFQCIPAYLGDEVRMLVNRRFQNIELKNLATIEIFFNEYILHFWSKQGIVQTYHHSQDESRKFNLNIFY